MRRLLPLLIVATSCTGTVTEPIDSLGTSGGEPNAIGGGVTEPARSCRPMAARALTRQAAVFPCATPTTPAAETQCLD